MRTPVIRYIIPLGYLKVKVLSQSKIFWGPGLCVAKPGEAETPVPASPLDSLTAIEANISFCEPSSYAKTAAQVGQRFVA